MKLRALVILAGVLTPVLFTGCQSNLGGQTLPSPNYGRDDVQYFPAGPEEQLPNLKRALKQYKLEQESL
ncbi:MAG TPA: hypothetical protein VLA12_13120 [Planctomycetaceae bacterium]|nr:hypothetical protein [Planctomycetaceae bacterium]